MNVLARKQLCRVRVSNFEASGIEPLQRLWPDARWLGPGTFPGYGPEFGAVEFTPNETDEEIEVWIGAGEV